MTDKPPRRENQRSAPEIAGGGSQPLTVLIPAAGAHVKASLEMPARAHGAVLIAADTGAQQCDTVISELWTGGFATLVLDLAGGGDEGMRIAPATDSPEEIERASGRLLAATDWLARQPLTRSLPLGYFAVGAMAASSLLAAARRPGTVHAIVACCGNPNAAGPALRNVRAPTLLIVDTQDGYVWQLNQTAQSELHVTNALEVVRAELGLLSAPAALRVAASLAREWFAGFLDGPPPDRPTPGIAGVPRPAR